MIRRLLPPALAAALALVPEVRADEGAPGDPAASFVLRGVRLETGDGTVVEDAVVVVRGGKVEAAGPAATVKPPAGLAVVEGNGGTAMPGFVLAAARLGLPWAQGGTERPTPSETVLEELNPFHPLLRLAAREGVAAAGLVPGPGAPGGEGVAVRPAAAGTAEFVRTAGRVLRVDVDPSTGWARGLAGALDAAKKEIEGEDRSEKEQAAFRAASAEYEAKKAALEKQFREASEKFEKEKAAAEKEGKPAPKSPERPDPGKPPAEPKPFKPEVRTAAVRDALRKKIPVVVFAGSAADADRALEALAPYRLRLAFRASGDAWRTAPRIAGAGAAVILEPQVQTVPGTLDRVNPAAVFEAAGCPVAFVPREESRRGLDSLLADAALLVRSGLPRKAAVRGLALEGAKVLGLDGETGTVAPGRSADLLLLDGDPFEATTRLRGAWSAGVRVFPAPGERP